MITFLAYELETSDVFIMEYFSQAKLHVNMNLSHEYMKK